MRKWSKEEEEILIKFGRNTIPSEILKLLPNKTTQQIRDKMYKTGIKLSQETYSKSKRIYSINEEFFRNQTQNMAYILGLWWSDGSIAPSHTGEINEFNITLKNEEKLLTQIRNEMGSNIPLKIHPQTGAFVLKIFSRKICQDLITLGGRRNKSKNLSWPNIDDDFIPSFIKGYFDGDGCISQKTGCRCLNILFACGDRTFLGTLKEKIIQLDHSIRGGWIANYTSENSKWYSLGFGERDSIKIANIMYNKNTSEYYMERKYTKFKQLYETKFLKQIKDEDIV